MFTGVGLAAGANRWRIVSPMSALLDNDVLRTALIAIAAIAVARLLLPWIPVVGPRLAGLV